MTDEKKKTEKKADDKIEEEKEELFEKSQPESKEKPEEIVTEEEKPEESEKESEDIKEKPNVDTEDKPIIDEKTEKVSIEKSEGENKAIEAKEEDSKSTEILEDSEKTAEFKEKKAKGKIKETKQQKDTKKPSKKKEEQDEDFQYIVRVANTDIDGNNNVVMGIAQIKGIGRHMAVLIADATGIDKTLKIGKLDESQIEKIRNVLENIENIAPGWMLNHRKDIDTGKDIHLISSDVDLRLRDDINLLKMIRSYRGIRHESGLTVRGQRTRANNRRGLALGVSKKRP